MSCYVSGCWTLVNEAFPYPEQSRRLSAAMHLCLALSGLFLVPLVFWGGARGVSFLRGLSSLGGRAAFLALTAVSFIMGAAGALGIMTLLDHLNEQGII